MVWLCIGNRQTDRQTHTHTHTHTHSLLYRYRFISYFCQLSAFFFLHPSHPTPLTPHTLTLSPSTYNLLIPPFPPSPSHTITPFKYNPHISLLFLHTNTIQSSFHFSPFFFFLRSPVLHLPFPLPLLSYPRLSFRSFYSTTLILSTPSLLFIPISLSHPRLTLCPAPTHTTV